jgi:hypothetical protein
MAQSDRKLTLAEVLSGNISQKYLDNKEQKAVIKRHISKLADQRFDIVDKMSVIGKTEELTTDYKKLSDKINKLQNELKSLSN